MVGSLFIIRIVKNGKLLAECIQASLSEAIPKNNNRVAKPISGIYIVDNVEIPLGLVECGFLSNPEEAKALTTPEYQDRVAFGIFTGISDYFNKGDL